ncbi:mite group 2 allergen-like Ixo r 2 [Panonychus citri]|uniref:mite group 2 allergen-like Ixo r 2 n=1 Tax=Panonychus citri TaxID=50023 RepID=UPI00230770A9|nr:mite group 2 allergen-like Ixo r 2 [Panonychus citri]
MIRSLVTLILIVATVEATGKNITFTNCVDTGKINWVTVDPCESEPCTFQPAMDVTVQGELVSVSTSTAPKLEVQVNVLGFWTTYPDLDSDGCKYLTCPLTAEKATAFKIVLTTLDWLPPMKTQIRFILYDNDGVTELNCAQADIKIA